MTHEPPPKVIPEARFNVYCGGTRKDGTICTEVLCRTSIPEWERTMIEHHGVIEFKCHRCKKVSEFR